MSGQTEVSLARSWWDYELCRRARNSCRHMMTRDTSSIGVLRQTKFWLRQRRVIGGISLYLVRASGVPIGYGLINRREHTVSGGIVPSWRGQGHGKALFGYLSNDVPKPASLEVLNTNLRAIALYESLGWKMTHQVGDVIFMEYVVSPTRPSPVRSDKGQDTKTASRKASPSVRSGTRKVSSSVTSKTPSSKSRDQGKAKTSRKAPKAPSS